MSSADIGENKTPDKINVSHDSSDKTYSSEVNTSCTDEESPIQRKKMKYESNEVSPLQSSSFLHDQPLVEKEEILFSPEKRVAEKETMFKTPEKLKANDSTNSKSDIYMKTEVTPTKENLSSCISEVSADDNLCKDEEETSLITEAEQARDLMLSLSAKKITPVKSYQATPTKTSTDGINKTPNAKRVPLTTLASPKPKKSNKSLF